MEKKSWVIIGAPIPLARSKSHIFILDKERG
jgi:hypothetical protein